MTDSVRFSFNGTIYKQAIFAPRFGLLTNGIKVIFKIRVANLLKVGNPGRNSKQRNKEDFDFIFISP